MRRAECPRRDALGHFLRRTTVGPQTDGDSPRPRRRMSHRFKGEGPEASPHLGFVPTRLITNLLRSLRFCPSSAVRRIPVDIVNILFTLRGFVCELLHTSATPRPARVQ